MKSTHEPPDKQEITRCSRLPFHCDARSLVRRPLNTSGTLNIKQIIYPETREVDA